MSHLNDMERGKAVIDSLEIDALTFTFCFRRGNDTIGVRMVGGRAMDIGQFVNRNST